MSANDPRPDGVQSQKPEPYQRPSVFSEKKKEPGGGMPLSVWLVAGGVMVLVLAVMLVVGRRRQEESREVRPPAAYAQSLPLSQLAMSESTSLSGGKSTFIDGRVKNTGGSTVGAVTVQVLFHNDEQMPPQMETTPLMLIRTREPYVDTQPVSAAPIGPGEEREFRLIFESIPTNWNMQMPEIRVVRVETR